MNRPLQEKKWMSLEEYLAVDAELLLSDIYYRVEFADGADG